MKVSKALLAGKAIIVILVMKGRELDVANVVIRLRIQSADAALGKLAQLLNVSLVLVEGVVAVPTAALVTSALLMVLVARA